jgi:hypothetical protein
MKTKIKNVRNPLKNPFSYIAFWQMLTFVLLILLVWYNELTDLPSIVFDTPPAKANVLQGCIMTAFILFAAIVVVGNTFLQEKRILNGLISICSRCHKVRINKDNWKNIEEYLDENTLFSFTHGLCPDCEKEVMKEINEKKENKKVESQPEKN